MSFLWSGMLWMLWVVPLILLCYLLLYRRRKKYALRYSSLFLIRAAVGRRSGIRRYIPPVLFLISLVSLVLALARPEATVITPSQRATVILTLDVSRSMLAGDVLPTRLEAAKKAAVSFVDRQPVNVDIGVVAFSGNAAIVQEPTRDREAVVASIQRLTVQSRTAIGSAILTSLETIFEEPGVQSKPGSNDNVLGSTEPTPVFTPVPRGTFVPAVIILLSDGVSNTGPLPLDVVQQAANRGVRIYTVGLGSSTGTPAPFGGYRMMMRLDENTLKSIAGITEGKYFKATSETDLLEIYNDLSTQLVFKPERIEITAWFAALAVAFALAAQIFSWLWFNQLP
jgi:Ca-activated chloride channel family protein